MRIITGTDNGLIKVLEVEENKISKSYGTQTKSSDIDNMVWAPDSLNPNEVESSILFTKRSNEGKSTDIGYWNFSTNLTRPDLSYLHYEGVVKSFESLPTGSSTKILTCTENGAIQLASFPLNSESSLTQEEKGPSLLFEVGKPISRMRINPIDKNQFVVGGNEYEPSVWNLETKQSIWKAKTAGHDKLNTRIPNWTTDIQYNPNQTNQIYAVTGYNKFKLYDIKAQRKPVVDLKFSPEPLTCMTLSRDANTLVAGDRSGNIILVDLRTRKILGHLRGIGGSIRGLNVHENLNYVASCSLDRFVRVHDLKNRKLLHRVYIKQRLTSVLFSKAGVVDIKAIEQKKKEEEIAEEEAQEEMEEDDEVWGVMKVVEENKPANKRKTNVVETNNVKKAKAVAVPIKKQQKQVQESDDDEDEDENDFVEDNADDEDDDNENEDNDNEEDEDDDDQSNGNSFVQDSDEEEEEEEEVPVAPKKTILTMKKAESKPSKNFKDMMRSKYKR